MTRNRKGIKMSKLLLRLGAVGVVAAGTVWAVRKYQANKHQAEELLREQVGKVTDAFRQGVAQTTEVAKTVQTYLDVAATEFANAWLGEPVNDEPTEEDEKPEEKPADQYTNSAPLLDDGR